MPAPQIIAVVGFVLLGALALGSLLLARRLVSRRARIAALSTGIVLLLGAAAGAIGAVAAGSAQRVPPAPAAERIDGRADAAEPRTMPDDFVDARELEPGIEVELRYAGTRNFTGHVVDGYEADDRVILQRDAAAALAGVQRELEAEGLGLRVYDAYRPTRAVRFFMDWARTDDDSTRAEYYPDFEKPQLFELGYIAERSKHSLGGTVDLTLVDLAGGEPLDMGGPFDFFGERSHYDAEGLAPEHAANRARLREAMIAGGFEPYELEWWHFSYPLGDDARAVDAPVR